jgi:hypothetical protein
MRNVLPMRIARANERPIRITEMYVVKSSMSGNFGKFRGECEINFVLRGS